MYPFVRLAWQFCLHRNAASLRVGETHDSTHYCLPWDLDLWLELNNGLTLSIYDMGRLPMAKRSGLIAALKRRRWGLTIAGSSVRYRKRIRVFDKIKMQSRAICADRQFIYLEQSMWVRGICAGHALYRTAVTNSGGIVSTVGSPLLTAQVPAAQSGQQGRIVVTAPATFVTYTGVTFA